HRAGGRRSRPAGGGAVSRAKWCAIAAGILLVAAGCAEDAPQDTWKPAGENAQRIHDLQWPVFLTAGIVGVLVIVVLIYIFVRFRDRGQPIPEQIHGKPALEITL